MTEETLHAEKIAAAAASEKKARDVVILNMIGLSPVTDYFVICSGGSGTQVKAIADHVEEKLQEQGITVWHKEGYRDAKWILLDYGSFVVHIFNETERRYYNLENLWADAEHQPFEDYVNEE